MAGISSLSAEIRFAGFSAEKDGGCGSGCLAIAINHNAIKCYTGIGLEEVKRIPEKHGKQKTLMRGFLCGIVVNESD